MLNILQCSKHEYDMNSECQLVPFFRYHVGTLRIKKLVQFSYQNCTNWPLGKEIKYNKMRAPSSQSWFVYLWDNPKRRGSWWGCIYQQPQPLDSIGQATRSSPWAGRRAQTTGGGQMQAGRAQETHMPLNLVQLDIREENFRTKLFY